jgi:metal-sulfur cluster biosynthetic enzyme
MNDEKRVNPHTGQPVPDDEPRKQADSVPGPSPADEIAEGPPPERKTENSSGAQGAQASAAGNGANRPAGAQASAPSGPAPTQQEMAIRSALETVMDPEIGLSVIDLGLIREIHFLDPPKTLVRMMLTTPFCPYAPQLMAEVKQATESVVPQPCEVEIMPDAWSPDMMPDPGLLGFSY